MQKLILTTALALAIGFASPVAAATITDTFDPTDVFFDGDDSCTGTNSVADTVTLPADSGCDSLSYTHSLVGLYNPVTETLASGTITVSFYDDADPSADKVDYQFDLLLGSNFTISDTSTAGSPIDLTVNVLSQISDGTLSVILTHQNGDFYFAKSVLTATTRAIPPNGDTAVPEPGSLLLLGSGLAFVARRMRRRSKTS